MWLARYHKKLCVFIINLIYDKCLLKKKRKKKKSLKQKLFSVLRVVEIRSLKRELTVMSVRGWVFFCELEMVCRIIGKKRFWVFLLFCTLFLNLFQEVSIYLFIFWFL